MNKKTLFIIIGSIAGGLILIITIVAIVTATKTVETGIEIYEETEKIIEDAGSLDSEIAQAQNQKFEMYFGKNVSSSQVKMLLSLVDTNNKTSSIEYSTIGVHLKCVFNGETIDYPMGEDIYITNVSGMKDFIQSGHTYTVLHPGDESYNTKKNGNDGFEEDENGIKYTTEDEAYYSSGFIRLIEIEDNYKLEEEENETANLASNLLSELFLPNNNEPENTNTSFNSEIAQAQNQKFSVYIGNKVTAAQLMQLLSLINTNNIISATSTDYKTIGVHFKYYSDGELVDYPDENIYQVSVTDISALIKSGHTYTVKIPGQMAYNAETNQNDGFSTDDDGNKYTDNKYAYYSTGFYRLFYIEQNEP